MGVEINEVSGRRKTLGFTGQEQYETFFSVDEQPVGLYGLADGNKIHGIGFFKQSCYIGSQKEETTVEPSQPLPIYDQDTKSTNR